MSCRASSVLAEVNSDRASASPVWVPRVFARLAFPKCVRPFQYCAYATTVPKSASALSQSGELSLPEAVAVW